MVTLPNLRLHCGADVGEAISEGQKKNALPQRIFNDISPRVTTEEQIRKLIEQGNISEILARFKEGEDAKAKAEARANRAEGTFFLSFADLTFKRREILNHSDPVHRSYIKSIRNADTMLKMYLPPTGINASVSKPVRTSALAGCPFDFLNNVRHFPIESQGAHVIPNSSSCHQLWEKLNRFRLNMEFTKNFTKNEQRQYKMWLYGYTVNAAVRKTIRMKNRKLNARVNFTLTTARISKKPMQRWYRNRLRNSGYLQSAANFIALNQQHERFDLFPSVLFIPYKRSALELWGCLGQALEFLVICSDAACCRAIAANVAETSNLSCTDPEVERAFEVFGEVMAVVIGVVRDDDHRMDPLKDNVRAFRELLKSQNTTSFQTPCIKAGCERYIMKVKLDPPRICPPGGVLKDWKYFSAHPNPEPINMMCRSYNAFSTHLYLNGELDGVARSQEKCCKLFPSCLDIEGVNDCNLCLAASLLHDPCRYLTTKDREKLLNIARLESSAIISKSKFFPTKR